MERLTERDEFGNVNIICVDGADLNECLTPDELEQVTEALNRLAAYEDTGLEPEEVAELTHAWNMYGGEDGINEALKELERYRKTEQEGRLVVLPCKVGDSYFTVEKFCDEGGNMEEAERHWGSDCEYCCVPCNAELRVMEQHWVSTVQILNSQRCIGKTLFLTREEAEAALKEATT